VALATEGDADSVTPVTALPNVIVLVVSAAPVPPPPTLANGAIVTLLEEDPGGLVPVAVIVTVAPVGIDEPRPKVTTFGVAPDTVALVTAAAVAVPPEGVKITV
jgi:hypothetical protein